MSAVPTQAFHFDPGNYRDEFAARGYVHLRNVVDPEFIAFALRQIENKQADPDAMIDRFQIKNKKAQYPFEFPTTDLYKGMCESIASLTSRPRELFMMSERLFKVYTPNANPRPPAHKDRLQSEISVGVPLCVPKGSVAVLWPDQSRTLNTYDTTELWRKSLREEELPENVLRGIEPIAFDVQPGDLIAFLGSTIYHERYNGAGTILAYFKFNAVRLDPLAQDLESERQRQVSLELLERSSDDELVERAADVSPRLLRVERVSADASNSDGLRAQIANGVSVSGYSVLIDDIDLRILQAINPSKHIQDSHNAIISKDLTKAEVGSRIRRLAKDGVVDVLPQPFEVHDVSKQHLDAWGAMRDRVRSPVASQRQLETV